MSVSVNWKGPQFIDEAGDAFRDGYEAVGLFYQGQVQRELRKNRSIAKPGTAPGARTGTLARSVVIDRSRLNADNPSVRVGTNLVYARIHEFGGIIKPKKAKWLAFFVGKGAARRFIRTKKVTMPARPYFRPTFNRNRQKFIDVFAANVRKSLEKAVI